jgi:GTP-binding protein
MKRLRLDFVMSCQGLGDVPAHGRPEIAFAGRSNVGKSSLINSISASGRPARTGSTPGCTQALNLYRVNGGGFYLVDLPGYGYARAPEEIRSRWVGWIGDYLMQRDALRGVVFLVDCRHPELGPDEEMAELLREIGRPYLIALTKSDKLKRGKLAGACRVARRLGPVQAVSAKKGTGLGMLLDWIRSAAAD